jgi:iron(III) transport system permease protein
VKRFFLIAALFATCAFLALFLIAPLSGVVIAGLRWELFCETWSHPVYQRGLFNALAIGIVSTALTLLIALPLALLIQRCRFAGKRIGEALLMAPLILPPFVGAIGITQVFGRFGMLNAILLKVGVCEPGAPIDWLGNYRFAAVCALEALHLYPIFYLTIAASLSRLDPALIQSARSLGASRWLVLRRIVLPLIKPGLLGGGLIVFVWSFTELGTPLMLGYERVTPVQIFNGLADLGGNPVPFALVVVLLALSLGLSWLAQSLLGRSQQWSSGRESSAVERPLGTLATVAAWLVLGGVIAGAILPHASVVLVALAKTWYGTVLPEAYTLAHFDQALRHESVVPGIRNSVIYSSLATVLALIIGGFIAWVSARWRPRGWRVLDALAMAPLAIPGVILAFAYLAFVSRFTWLREWLDPTRNPTILLAIAYAVRRLPHVVRAAHASLSQAPLVLEEAAASLGAGAAYRFRRITIPLIASGLIAGAVMTFSFSMLEVSDSLVLAQKHEFFPITKVIYELVTIIGPGPSLACAFATWAMAFLAAALCAGSLLIGRRGGGMLGEQ